MFTGIVEEVGKVRRSLPSRLTIAAKKVLEGTRLGDSIAVNGACLTVVSLEADAFTIDIMPETVEKTSLGKLRPGDPVNLERAMSLGGRLGGHLVQGHIDATGKVLSLTPVEGAILVSYWAPSEVMRYIVPKGFIAVDGASLTVVNCNMTSFTISLVAFTQQNTNLAGRKPGDLVNLEVDIIAKYVEKLRGGEASGITQEFLAKHGFATQ